MVKREVKVIVGVIKCVRKGEIAVLTSTKAVVSSETRFTLVVYGLSHIYLVLNGRSIINNSYLYRLLSACI